MKSDHHQIFRVSSWGSPKVIQHVKNYPILQDSSQEPSMSSKYGLEGWGVLDTLVIILRAEILHTSQESHMMMIYDVKEDPILQVSSQDPSTSSKYGLRSQGVLDTILIMLESWNFAHKSRITYDDDPWRQGRPHPPSLQSGTINILQIWTSRAGGSWHTSYHVRELKFCTQVKNHIWWLSMT